MNWNDDNLLLLGFLIGVSALGAMLKIIHAIRRMFERSCRVCGTVFMTETAHYICESQEFYPPRLFRKLCDTITFRRCRKGHLNFKSDPNRWMSLWAWWWRKIFHPSHFARTPEIEALFEEAGLNRPGYHWFPPGGREKAFKIPPLHVPSSPEVNFAKKPSRGNQAMRLLALNIWSSRP